MLEHWLPSTLHICQNRLPEVPTEELIGWSFGVIKRSLIKVFSGNALPIPTEAYDLVIILL